jgi:imidazoleglycerol phosphate synthase glutamine amidotransferase subunit HisH
MIRIVDYGVGNIQAFLTMFKRLDAQALEHRQEGLDVQAPGHRGAASAQRR